MKKYQVFVSSTYEDLIDERMAAISILLDNNCIPVGMEQFPASGLGIMEYIQKVLTDCDYYILILAGRYGSVDKDGVGFTEKEFDYAKAQSIPTLVFCNKNTDNLPLSKSEKTDSGRELLAKFREKVKTETVISYYSTANDLASNIATAINKAKEDTPRPGWIRDLDGINYGNRGKSNYALESSGSFASVRMQESRQPLFFGNGERIFFEIVAKKDYLVRAYDDKNTPLKLALIPKTDFPQENIFPEQYALFQETLHIENCGGVLCKYKSKYVVLRLIQTGQSVLEYEGRYAVYEGNGSILKGATAGVQELEQKVKALRAEIDQQPKIHIGTDTPKTLKNGDVYLQIE